MRPDETSDHIQMSLTIGGITYTVSPGRWSADWKSYQLRRLNGGSVAVTQGPGGSTHCTCADFASDDTCPHVEALLEYGLFQR